MAHGLYEIWTTDLRPRLGGIQTPMVVLYPFDPTMGVPQAMIDGIYNNGFAALPNKRLVRIDGSYHFVQIDQPEVFHGEVVKFLAERGRD